MTTLAPVLRRGLRATAIIVGATISAGVTSMLIGSASDQLAGNRMGPWILGRASGVCSYMLMVALVLMGLFLSHPWRARVRRPATATRIRLHIALAVFTLAFTALHIVTLATDKWAGVGWSGAFLPMHASYRPVATTMGVIGTWSGLLAGITAAMAGRLPRRAWWPIHKVAGVALVLVWLHGVLGGGDTPALLSLYIVTGVLVGGVAVSRYVVRRPADLVAELESMS